MRSINIALMALLLSGCMPKVEEKVKLVPRSQGGSSQYPGRWSAANLSSPLPVEISSALAAEFDASDLDAQGDDPIVQAMKSWNEAHPDLDFFDVPAGSIANKSSTDLTSYRDGTLGIYMSYDWFPGISSETIAITQYYGFLREPDSANTYIDLTHADIIVNYRDHAFSTSPSFAEFDIQTVILHELGHFIGLKHPSDYFVPAVMQSTLSQGTQKRNLFAYDNNAVISNYNGYNANLTHFNAAAVDRGYDDEEAQEVSGYYELRRDGRCLQWLNGKLVHTHQH